MQGLEMKKTAILFTLIVSVSAQTTIDTLKASKVNRGIVEVSQSTPAGYHSLTWNATNDLGDPVSAGVYLYQLKAKDFVKTRKMVLLK